MATPLLFSPPSLFLPEVSLGASRCDWASRGLSAGHNWTESPPLDRWPASIGRGAVRGWPNLLVSQAETLGVGLRRSGRLLPGALIWEAYGEPRAQGVGGPVRRCGQRVEGPGEPGAAGEAGWRPLSREGPAWMPVGTLVEEIAIKLDVVV